MLKSLRIQRDTIALEYFSGGKLAGMFKQYIPEMISGLRQSLTVEFNPTTTIKLPTDQRKFLERIIKHPYLDLAPLSVYVPEGMNTTYASYLLRLDVSVDLAKNIIDGVLSPVTVYLSQLISNDDMKFSSASHDKLFSELEQNLKNANLSLTECFKKGATFTEAKYSAVIDRNSDWEGVLHNAHHLSNEMNRVDRKVLNRKIKECSTLLDTIIVKSRRGDFDTASNAVAKNLAESIYHVAAAIEFFSVTYYRVDALVNCINQTTDKITEVTTR